MLVHPKDRIDPKKKTGVIMKSSVMIVSNYTLGRQEHNWPKGFKNTRNYHLLQCMNMLRDLATLSTSKM
jgi:hypothetical protein